ncbi:hypothetical protein [Clostridium butyricum]|nr:hypothetical protein [Clostridium butyricum]MDU3594755.1 hypothetical protein [Clostridium butyricum]
MSKVLTTEEFIKVIKKNTKFIEVDINSKKVNIPLRWSAKALKDYIHEYTESNDIREAFYAMLTEMIDCNKNMFKENIEIQNVQLDDIKLISNEDFEKIGKCLLENTDEIKEYYDENYEGDFLAKFNEAINKEYEHVKQESEMIWEKTAGRTEGIRKALYKIAENTNRMEKGIYPNLEDVVKNDNKIIPINLNDTVSSEQLEVIKQMADTLIEMEKQSKIDSEKNNQRAEKNDNSNEENGKIAKISMAVGILTLIATVVLGVTSIIIA